MPSDESGRRRPSFDNDDLQPNIAMWGKKPLRFGAAYRSRLKHSRHVSVYLSANVTEILLNHTGTSVEALDVVSLSGKRFRVKAKRFVLACGGMENARLLLVSRGVQESGIGNLYDVVGRYFMGHPRAVFGKIQLSGPHKFPLLLGFLLSEGMAQVGIQFSEEMQTRGVTQSLSNPGTSIRAVGTSIPIICAYDEDLAAERILGEQVPSFRCNACAGSRAHLSHSSSRADATLCMSTGQNGEEQDRPRGDRAPPGHLL